MGIVDVLFRSIEREGEVKKLRLDNSILNASLQAATNILTATSDDEATTGYTGNPYRTFSSQVSQLSQKYSNTAKWGCLIAKNIIDVRAAFLIGAGIQVVKRESYDGDAARELKFLRSFIEFNKLDSAYPSELAKEGEIEGRALLRLKWDVAGENIRVIYTPFRQFPYEVLCDAPNFFRFLQAKYVGTGIDQKGSATLFPNNTYDAGFDVKEGEFVYVRLGGNIFEPNITPSKTSYVLRQIEDLDKEMWDWRKINHLYAAPTPKFEFDAESVDEARRTEDYITKKNWRIGKAIVLAGGTFTLETYKGEGFTTIEKAVQTDIQLISGATGVPVHFLGFPNLLSNRSTADSLFAMIQLSTDKERDAWRAGYTELAQKAVVMYNEMSNQNLKPEACEIVIPFASAESLAHIEKVYLPMYVAGAMSLEQLLSYVTNVDMEKEMARIKVMQAEKQKQAELAFKQQETLAGKWNTSAT